MAGSNIPHYGPFVIKICPWPTTSCHLKNNATKGPYIDAAMPSSICARNNCSRFSKFIMRGRIKLVPSGDMYIGVPVILFSFVFAAVAAPRVFPCLAITLAAPKSTYLMMPLWSNSMSVAFISANHPLAIYIGELTLRLDISVHNPIFM